jgi:hypothetical protein
MKNRLVGPQSASSPHLPTLFPASNIYSYSSKKFHSTVWIVIELCIACEIMKAPLNKYQISSRLYSTRFSNQRWYITLIKNPLKFRFWLFFIVMDDGKSSAPNFRPIKPNSSLDHALKSPLFRNSALWCLHVFKHVRRWVLLLSAKISSLLVFNLFAEFLLHTRICNFLSLRPFHLFLSRNVFENWLLQLGLVLRDKFLPRKFPISAPHILFFTFRCFSTHSVHR